jgi:hypothetical protein
VPIAAEDDHVVVDVETDSDVVIAVVVVDTRVSEEGIGTVSDVEVDMEIRGEEDVKVDALVVAAPGGLVVADPTAMMSHASYSAPDGATRTICIKGCCSVV